MRAPGPPPPTIRKRARGRRWGPGSRLLALALALGLFIGGVALGSALAGRSRARTLPATPAASVASTTTAAPSTTARSRQVSPPACLSAIDDADAVISYLVANVRDQRLAKTMEQFRAASATCRRAR